MGDKEMNNLRVIMAIKNMTQTELAKASGVDQGEISRILKGKKPGIHLKTAQKIAHALGCCVEDIWPYEWWLGK